METAGQTRDRETMKRLADIAGQLKEANRLKKVELYIKLGHMKEAQEILDGK